MGTIGRLAIGTHGFVAVWLVVNGIAHQIGVLWKSHAGTLRPDASVPALLAVGAGLVISGGVHSWGLGGLLADRPAVGPALAGVGVLALVVAGTAAAYGFTFLRGTIVLAVVNLIAVVALVAAR